MTDRDQIETLTRQNQSLRHAIVALEDEKARLDARLQSVLPLLEEVDRLKNAVHRLEAEKIALERYAGGLRTQYVEAEQHGNTLAHLYVTTSRLHGTCNRNEVLRAIREVLGFFVGVDQAAVFELDEGGRFLKLVDSWGIDREEFWRVPVGRGRIGRSVLGGETYLAGDSLTANAQHQDEERLTACIPLKLEGRVTGAIVLFGLQPQKEGRLSTADRELLNLLATHAATALYCTSLHERLQRQAAEA